MTDNSKFLQLDQKYRPETIDDIILPPEYKRAFKNYIRKGQIPHLLLYSAEPGTGKTTTAKAIVHDMNLDPRYDYLFLKGDNVNVSFIKNDLYDFCANASPTGNRRVVIIDEYDRPTLGEAHRQMRTIIDEFSDSVTFIVTANDPHNIHEAFRNRMHAYNFGGISEEDSELMQIQFFERMKEICKLEGYKVEDERILRYIVAKNFPFFRTCLTELNKYAFMNDFVLDVGILSSVAESNKAVVDIINLIKSDKIDKDKLMAVAKSNSYNASTFINTLYNKLTKEVDGLSQIELIKIIGEMNKTFDTAINKDIHLFYMLILLHTNLKWK